ncbi:MAG: 23S rRNA (uracil(1939)-C(5))-methyltransferase RlmD [Angelakisella sp.]
MDNLVPVKTTPPCPLYKKCGGCQMQNMLYPQQLRWKQVAVERLLSRFCPVAPIIGMENPLHYRNKVQAAFRLDRQKRIISGVYQSGTHNIVQVDDCMIEDTVADEIIVTIRKMLPQFKLLPYNEDTGRGFLRHVLIRRGFTSGQIMVVLVTGLPMFPSKNNFVAALLKLHPGITTIVQNVNSTETSLVLGERQMVLYGNGFIEDTLCGCVFRISPRSFYQINPVQTELLYSKAIQLAGLTGQERVIDAYCGIGTIGLIASRSCREVIGVELNRDAVRDAIDNCRRNGIKNARFYSGDAGEFMTAMAAEDETADVVFLDPPRAGSDTAFLNAVATLAPQKVVYISCNPETLARDLVQLTGSGYAVRAVQPVDMFPFTHHVECVVLLTRK